MWLTPTAESTRTSRLRVPKQKRARSLRTAGYTCIRSRIEAGSSAACCSAAMPARSVVPTFSSSTSNSTHSSKPDCPSSVRWICLQTARRRPGCGRSSLKFAIAFGRGSRFRKPLARQPSFRRSIPPRFWLAKRAAISLACWIFTSRTRRSVPAFARKSSPLLSTRFCLWL